MNKHSTGSLTDPTEVRLILGQNLELNNGEIASMILDVDEEIKMDYGDPIDKDYFYFETDQNTYQVGQRNIYRFESIECDGSDIPLGSFTLNNASGMFDVASDVATLFDGTRCEVEYVPKIYNVLAKNLTVLRLLEVHTTWVGDRVQDPRISRLRDKIDQIKSKIMSCGFDVMRSSQWETWDKRKGDYVYQDTNNTF